MSHDSNPFVLDTDPNKPEPIEWTKYYEKVVSEWYALLAQDPEEEDVQQFLELHPAMIPGGAGDIGPGGHNGAELGAVFRKPSLSGSGRTYIPDFMWITYSTSLITPILIEIEKPSKKWFTSKGHQTAEFTQAHDQLANWKSWFAREGNSAIFRERFLFGNKWPNRQLQPQYVLIYGRQSEFDMDNHPLNLTPSGLRHKRASLSREDEQLMTFDSLKPRWELSPTITVTMTPKGPRPFALSPRFGTSAADSGKDAQVLGDLDDALDRSVWMPDERKAYIAKRWSHWWALEREHAHNQRIMFRTKGLE